MWNRAETQVILALIRHGATSANREHRYLGSTDESLSKEGIMTLMSYKQQKKYPDVDYLFISPMRRCLETAAILYPNLCPVMIPEWTEMDFGEFEYKNYEELNGDARYQAWIDNGGTIAFPGGESREEFIQRCEHGFVRMYGELHRAAELCQKRAVHAGIIVHGGTIMALMSSHDCAQSGKFVCSQEGVCDGVCSDALRQKDYFDYQVANGRGYLCRMEIKNDDESCAQTNDRQMKQIWIREIKKL